MKEQGHRADVKGTSPLGYFLIILTLVFIFLQALLKVYDYDVWFHLKAGQYILTNMTVPRADVFSYTAYGKPWVTHEWLFEAVLYLVYSAGGLYVLPIFKALIITAAFGVHIVYLRRRGISPYIIVTVVLAASILARDRYIVRPEILTYLFTAFFVCTLERFRLDPDYFKTSERYLWALPLTMPLWANSHSGAIFGLIFIGAYGLGEAAGVILLQFRPSGQSPGPSGRSKSAYIERIKTLTVIFLAAFFSGLLNPNTYQAYTYPFRALDISRTTGLNIAEYTPPAWSSDYLFFIFLTVSFIVLVVNFRRVRFVHLLLTLFFSFTAFRFNRNIAMWALVMVPVMSEYVGVSWNNLKSALGTDLRKGPAINDARLTALFSALVILTTAPFILGTIRSGEWGPGVREKWFPEGAVQFIEEVGIKGNMYNSYEFGGYLIWRLYPERRVYIDGRSEVYEELLMEQRMLSILGFERIIDKYDINYAVFSYAPGNVDYIKTDPFFGTGLVLVYRDETSMVYIRNTPGNRGIIEKYGYR